MVRIMAPLLVILALACARLGWAVGLQVETRDSACLEVRLTGATPGGLYRVTYHDEKHQFVWENLTPEASGLVTLTDDKYLRPEYRLRCESRLSTKDPVVFDDVTKGVVSLRRRLPFGVPVSTFGGPGYLVPGYSMLARDVRGNFWLYLDHAPYALLKYDAKFHYQFALLLPGEALAFDTDDEGNLWVLHPGNWLSEHTPLGQTLGAWDLPFGRKPGEFSIASGLAIDREHKLLYISDEVLSRVQRFDLQLNLQPIPTIPWGWIGREDLSFTRAGQYDSETMYNLLDRPREVRLDGAGHLYVSSEHYISKFDLGTGKQVAFRRRAGDGMGGDLFGFRVLQCGGDGGALAAPLSGRRRWFGPALYCRPQQRIRRGPAAPGLLSGREAGAGLHGAAGGEGRGREAGVPGGGGRPGVCGRGGLADRGGRPGIRVSRRAAGRRHAVPGAGSGGTAVRLEHSRGVEVLGGSAIRTGAS